MTTSENQNQGPLLPKAQVSFRSSDLLEQALTHRSYFNENPERVKGHNERLEFLGDAVLDLVLSDLLMHNFPEKSEGELSKLRASLVNEAVLAEMALEFEFQNHLRLGRGEANSGGAQKPRLLASVFEAFVGAVYVDSGFDRAFEFLQRAFQSRLANLDLEQHFVSDYKTRLQELAQEKFRQAPVYEILAEMGPDHDKSFHVVVKVAGQALAEGRGKSKKQAEQDSAKQALEVLK